MKRFGVSLAIIVAIGVTTTTGLTSCTDAAGSGLGFTSVTATDGTYTDRIDVSWSSISKTDSQGNEIPIDRYEIERQEKPTGPIVTFQSSSTDYTDTGVTPGLPYEYSVTGYFTDGTSREIVLSDTGYAMDAVPIDLYASSDDGAIEYDARAVDRWFNFLGQEGWTYTITTTGAGTALNLYQIGTIEYAETPTMTAGNIVTFKIRDSEIHHIKVTGGEGTIIVNYD